MVIFARTEHAYIFSLSPRTTIDENYIDSRGFPKIHNSHSLTIDPPIKVISYCWNPYYLSRSFLSPHQNVGASRTSLNLVDLKLGQVGFGLVGFFFLSWPTFDEPLRLDYLPRYQVVGYRDELLFNLAPQVSFRFLVHSY